ncbi:MAG: hypothetical protein JNK53_09065 [Phycisphaerae bacterium]|nr:hypothetical protein [Phycisphaerae bacterium]
MAILSRQRFLAAGLVLAGVLSFVPSPWMAPWSSEFALVVTAPVRPVQAGLAWLRQWLRPPYEPYAGLAPDAARLAQERDILQGELDRERMRSAALERQLQEYRVVVDADTRGNWRPVMASVVERPGGRRKDFGLSAGHAFGVAEGDPVVVGGNRLVGRVVGPVDASHAWMTSTDDARLGRIDGLVYPGARASDARRAATMIQLTPVGQGRLRGEIDRTAIVEPGDVVLLNDTTWKDAAQGMRIGVVDRVGAMDSNPLRTGVEVVMEVEPARVGPVTLKVRDETVPSRTPGGRP